MRRHWRKIVLCLFAFLMVFGVAGIPVYVFPQVADSPRKVDVIMVLGGRQDGREDYGISLAERGLASTVLISDPYDEPDEYMDAICDAPHRVRVICFRPSPKTTRGEARFLRDQAKANGWRSAMVITFTPHVTRSDYIVSRCFTGDLVMVNYTSHIPIFYWAYMYLYQTGGFIRAALQNGC
ncbi:MAG: YdcF family protein [Corynebacteriales bacterium]|nr:YdcF family protein [Mycobacteriales bacterium]